jgi:hypothetical protein
MIRSDFPCDEHGCKNLSKYYYAIKGREPQVFLFRCPLHRESQLEMFGTIWIEFTYDELLTEEILSA